ncbi:hypothetical protein VNO78_23574 [Psophocarpus tetragonolobus]|uniref:Uncharacterized protein n=1 Tax=Psophocarpus tetragonolobus TaxID=3891 RepID=A0AAN9S4D2_PSOTE
MGVTEGEREELKSTLHLKAQEKERGGVTGALSTISISISERQSTKGQIHTNVTSLRAYPPPPSPFLFFFFTYFILLDYITLLSITILFLLFDLNPPHRVSFRFRTLLSLPILYSAVH